MPKTFTPQEQEEFRKKFIEQCKYEAWSAGCHAAWVSADMDRVLEGIKELQAKDKALEEEAKTIQNGLDYHTVENRQKVKKINEQRAGIERQIQSVTQLYQNSSQNLSRLIGTIEGSISLAEYAKEWEWKEVESKEEDKKEDETTVEKPTA